MIAWDGTDWLTGTVNRMNWSPGRVQPDLRVRMIARDRTNRLTGTVNL